MNDRVDGWLLAISGKMGSGKDTVGELVAERLGGQWVRLGVGGAIRRDAMMRMTRCDAGTFRPAFGWRLENGEIVYPTFGEDRPEGAGLVAHGPQRCGCGKCINPYSSIPATRFEEFRECNGRETLQWIAKDRRLERTDYWVTLLMAEADAHARAGRSVGWPDVREINEIEAAQNAGFYTVRLDVDDATQRQRLMTRDGKLPSETAFTHPNETALDDYAEFDLRLDAQGPAEQTADRIAAAMRQWKTDS